MDERDISLFNLYLYNYDIKGFIWEFYNTYRVEADDEGLCTATLDELEAKFRMSRKTLIKHRNILFDLKLIQVIGKVGQKEVVRFVPFMESVFGPFIKNNVRPDTVREALRTGKPTFNDSLPPCDEYDYSTADMRQIDKAVEIKPHISTASYNKNKNNIINISYPYYCEAVEIKPHISTASTEEPMNQEIRANARRIYETWNTTLKEYAHRSGTPIPKQLNPGNTGEIPTTSLAHAVCQWVLDQGDVWEDNWNMVIEKLKVNRFLQKGFGVCKNPGLSWLFAISPDKGTGIQRVLDGKYDMYDEAIPTVTKDNKQQVADKYASYFKNAVVGDTSNLKG